jgi:hypothetical protein
MSDRPNLTDDARLARAEGLVASEVNGETVILCIENGHFFHLNVTGSRIWSLFDAPMTFGELCASLRDRFAVDADQCRRDVAEFVEQMVAQGVLERT